MQFESNRYTDCLLTTTTTTATATATVVFCTLETSESSYRETILELLALEQGALHPQALFTRPRFYSDDFLLNEFNPTTTHHEI